MTDETAANMESIFELLVTARDCREAEQKAIAHLREHVVKFGAVDFSASVTALEPGELPFWGEPAPSLDLREVKTAFTKPNRLHRFDPEFLKRH